MLSFFVFSRWLRALLILKLYLVHNAVVTKGQKSKYEERTNTATNLVNEDMERRYYSKCMAAFPGGLNLESSQGGEATEGCFCFGRFVRVYSAFRGCTSTCELWVDTAVVVFRFYLNGMGGHEFRLS